MKTAFIGLNILCGLAFAEQTASPSAWWSGANILSSSEETNYITKPVSTSDLVGAFSQDSFLLARDSNPELVAFILCETLDSDAFMPFGAMESLSGVVSRAKSSVLIPQTLADNAAVADVVAAATAKFCPDCDEDDSVVSIGSFDGASYESVQEFLDGGEALFSNGQTDFVVIAVPTAIANTELSALDATLHKKTGGNYLATVMANSALSSHSPRTSTAGRKLLAVSELMVEGTGQGSNIHITPGILLGLLLSFFLIAFLYVGICGIANFGETDQFWPPHKENRPLQGIVDK